MASVIASVTSVHVATFPTRVFDNTNVRDILMSTHAKGILNFDPRRGILKESPIHTRNGRRCGRQSEAAAALAAVHDGCVIDSAAFGIPPRMDLLPKNFLRPFFIIIIIIIIRRNQISWSSGGRRLRLLPPSPF